MFARDLLFGNKESAARSLIGILRSVSHQSGMALLDEGRDVHDETGPNIRIKACVDYLERPVRAAPVSTFASPERKQASYPSVPVMA